MPGEHRKIVTGIHDKLHPVIAPKQPLQGLLCGLKCVIFFIECNAEPVEKGLWRVKGAQRKL